MGHRSILRARKKKHSPRRALCCMYGTKFFYKYQFKMYIIFNKIHVQMALSSGQKSPIVKGAPRKLGKERANHWQISCSQICVCCVHRDQESSAPHKVRLSPWGEYQHQNSGTLCVQCTVHHSNNIGGRVDLVGNNKHAPALLCRWCAALNMYFSTLQYNLLHKFWKL